MTSEFAIAVHTLVYLNHKAQILSSEALACNVCTNPARIRKVMAKLKNAGLVATKEGSDGGYQFLQKPEKVTLRMVDEAVGGTLVSAAWKPGNEEMDCLVASGMANIMDGIYAELDELCRQKLSHITILDIDRKIFGEPATDERRITSDETI